ncbi:MAG: ABC transporter permease [Spirochaetes bacterium]|nr:ABC transporter permease [Spirochaetota bacterium]
MSGQGTAVLIAANAVSAMTPLLLAALGGLFTELSGTLNIALEGLMLIGAFFGAASASASGSVLLGMAGGSLAGALLAWAYGSATINLDANPFITGLATNIFASGSSVLLSKRLFGSKSVVTFVIPAIQKPFARALGGIPVLGPILFSQSWIVYASWLAAFTAWVLISRTVFGARIRATGANSEAVSASGFSPDRYRLAAIVISGVLSGAAGASLSLPLSAYVPNMSAGRGWIALVAVYLGFRKPWGIALACFTFALAESYSNYAQGFRGLPSEFILVIPYAASLLALAVGTIARRAGVKRGGNL